MELGGEVGREIQVAPPVGLEVEVLDEPLCLRLGRRGATGALLWAGVDRQNQAKRSARDGRCHLLL